MSMRTCLFLLSTTALMATGFLTLPDRLAAGGAKADTSDRAQVVRFFKEQVIGKTLATPPTKFPSDNNNMEGDYADNFVFNNLTETAEGLSFDWVTVSKQTIYDLDKGGKRIQPGRDFSGVYVGRYEICERTSTKRLTGTMRPVSTTVKAPSPEGTVALVTGMKVAYGKLTWTESLQGYGDFATTKGKYKPRAWDGKVTIEVVNGKLQLDYDQTNFDVDPDTFKRTPAKDIQPLYVGREIAGK